MKKHLIAAAVAAAVAVPAMAQVTVYGILSTGYSSIKDKGSLSLRFSDADLDEEFGEVIRGSRKTTSFGTQGLQSGSRLGFRGTEDIGGGMKVGFVYELTADLNTGLSDQTTDNRLGYVEVSGSFGTIRGGRVNSLSKDAYDSLHAHGGSGFAPGNQSAALSRILTYFDGNIDGIDADGIGAYGNVRHSNSVGYISPTVNGFSVQIQHAQEKADGSGEDGTDTNNRVRNLGLKYSDGPLAVTIAHDTSKNSNNDKQTRQIIGGTYNFGVARAFITNTKLKYDDIDFKLKDLTVGAHIPLGNVTLIASYSDGEVKDRTDGATFDSKGYQLGANYALSKRTLLLARYGKSEFKGSESFDLGGGDGFLRVGLKGSVDGIGIGIQHSF